MRCARIALLALILLLLFSLSASGEYALTPVSISEEIVVQKFQALEYLSPDLSAKEAKKALPSAIVAFQTDQAMEPAEALDTRTLVRLFALTDELPQTLWVPVHGGQRYHCLEACSSMDEPESVSIKTALELGFTPCKRCKP